MKPFFLCGRESEHLREGRSKARENVVFVSEPSLREPLG